jgi:hypothetical protein
VTRGGEGGAGGVVRVAGIRQQERAPAFDEHEGELDDRGLRARDHRDLAHGIELDAVHTPVALGNRLLQRGQAAKGRVSVAPLPPRGLRQPVEHVQWRPYLRISAREVDQRLAAGARRVRDARNQGREVLPRQALEALRRVVHGAILGRRAARSARDAHNQQARRGVCVEDCD